MPTSYPFTLQQKYRVTLDLKLTEDFNPHQLDWQKLLDIQVYEDVSSYVEDLGTPDYW